MAYIIGLTVMSNVAVGAVCRLLCDQNFVITVSADVLAPNATKPTADALRYVLFRVPVVLLAPAPLQSDPVAIFRANGSAAF